MRLDLLAFSAAAAFFGAALYVNIVEQPARLALGPGAMVREWARSNHRGCSMMATLAVISAILAYMHYGLTGDLR